jgi:hypothetical protein
MRIAFSSSKMTAARVIIVAGAGTLVAGIISAVVLVTASQNAHAKPEYAAKEGKPCGYCHVNPAGGGPRNAKGKQYQANGHKFKK